MIQRKKSKIKMRKWKEKGGKKIKWTGKSQKKKLGMKNLWRTEKKRNLRNGKKKVTKEEKKERNMPMR